MDKTHYLVGATTVLTGKTGTQTVSTHSVQFYLSVVAWLSVVVKWFLNRRGKGN